MIKFTNQICSTLNMKKQNSRTRTAKNNEGRKKKLLKLVEIQFPYTISDHSGVWPKVSLVFEDFKFKISEG